MQYKTSSIQFEHYGSVYSQPLNPKDADLICKNWNVMAKRNIGQLYCFNCEVCIEMQTGMASILVGYTPEASALECFAIHRQVRIKPNVYFSVVAVTPSIFYKLLAPAEYVYSTVTLEPQYVFNRVLPRIRINEILGYYYSIRNSGYSFKGEIHNYFELTYVDRGMLLTEVDSKAYELKEKDLIIYGPGQFHTQSIPKGQSCSYVTIVFEMDTIIFEEESDQYQLLLNKVFHYDKKIHSLVKTFVQESTSDIPYMNSLMLCLLQEIVVRLLQYEFIGQRSERPVTNARQHYQDELLEEILDYIEKTISEPLTVEEICQKFSLSRSSLQLLFKENLHQTPKKYISDLKLEKACQMIRESKYTISEIALMLGFTSIHYFSKAFAQKYHLAPSEYSKQIFNIQ